MPFRFLVACAALSFLSLYHVFNNVHLNIFVDGKNGPPDLSHYRPLQVVSQKEFPFGDPSRRVILVGDIHGQYDHLQSLLTRLSYDNKTDTLIHLGDIVTKGSLHGSLDVLSFLSSNEIQGVRGNQDQKVIEWRGWIAWINSKPGGEDFLRTARHSWKKAEKKGKNLKSWNKHQRQLATEKVENSVSADQLFMDDNTAKWWLQVPDGWLLFSDSYMVAAEMTERHYEYLISLPLRIHVPHAHMFLVHAGLLSHDPKRDVDDPSQPLSHAPSVSRVYAYGDRFNKLRGALNPFAGWLAKLVLQNQDSYREDIEVYDLTEDVRREKQERAILALPLNMDPWVTQNIRSVKHGKPTRGKKGEPWSEIWNVDMNMCHGFDPRDTIGVMSKHRELPCLPMSVIYGHAAARGLDIKRWSFGLDTGCVKKRRLTALVHSGNMTHDDEDELIPFGDAGHAQIVSVKCKS
ncbi:Metallo-dependent phosphatase-like protein [Amanita rubescens]|nr:Metallo-dependent phosphatase-like protein [Amanita rubescens]